MTAFHHPDLFTGESWVRGLTLPPRAQVHVWPSAATISDWAFEDTCPLPHTNSLSSRRSLYARQLFSTGLTLKWVAIRMFNNQSLGRNQDGGLCIFTMLYIPGAGLDSLHIVFHLILKTLWRRHYSPVGWGETEIRGNLPEVTELITMGLQFKSLWLHGGPNLHAESCNHFTWILLKIEFNL